MSQKRFWLFILLWSLYKLVELRSMAFFRPDNQEIDKKHLHQLTLFQLGTDLWNRNFQKIEKVMICTSCTKVKTSHAYTHKLSHTTSHITCHIQTPTFSHIYSPSSSDCCLIVCRHDANIHKGNAYGGKITLHI